MRLRLVLIFFSILTVGYFALLLTTPLLIRGFLEKQGVLAERVDVKPNLSIKIESMKLFPFILPISLDLKPVNLLPLEFLFNVELPFANSNGKFEMIRDLIQGSGEFNGQIFLPFRWRVVSFEGQMSFKLIFASGETVGNVKIRDFSVTKLCNESIFDSFECLVNIASERKYLSCFSREVTFWLSIKRAKELGGLVVFSNSCISQEIFGKSSERLEILGTVDSPKIILLS